MAIFKTRASEPCHYTREVHTALFVTHELQQNALKITVCDLYVICDFFKIPFLPYSQFEMVDILPFTPSH